MKILIFIISLALIGCATTSRVSKKSVVKRKTLHFIQKPKPIKILWVKGDINLKQGRYYD